MIIFFSPLQIWAKPTRCIPAPPVFGVALDGYPITSNRIQQVYREMGLSPGMILFFLQWPSLQHQDDNHFPKESLDAIWNSGAIPCLTWEPMYYKDTQEIMIPYTSILRGDYNTYIEKFAKNAARWQKPFMIRFAHEMNINRYHWGSSTEAFGPESPEIYKKIFRYVVNTFRQAGAHNVKWVFCPNAESVPNPAFDSSAHWNCIKNYFPGNQYVDIIGIDGYNWGNSQTKAKHGWDSQWKAFKTIFSEAFDTLKEIVPEKPRFIFETACVRQDGNRNLWIQQAFETIQAWQIEGLTWFQVHKTQDWRLTIVEDAVSIDFIRTATSFPHQWLKEVIQ
jgi:hypothetical protein